MDTNLDFKLHKPQNELASFIESFWMLHNQSDRDKEIVVLPDGRLDLIFSQSTTEPFHVTLSGIETHYSQATLKAQTLMLSISFKLPAVEYVLNKSIAGILNSAAYMPAGFWDITQTDLHHFESFCIKATNKIKSALPETIDERKLKLFDLIYSTNGSVSVQELSEKIFWSPRQINRYFNQQFGLSLKSYCNIIRFRASFPHIKDGRLFPLQNFSDQPHFIKEVKKLSGVTPKALKQNQNDRFIQFSMLPPI